MNPNIEELVEVFARLGIEVQFGDLSHEDVRGKGGLARIHDKKIIILDSGLYDDEKIDLLITELKKFELSDIYISPRLRKILAGGKSEINNNDT